LKSNYIYKISDTLKKTIQNHGFTEKEIYPKCNDIELKQYINISDITDENNNNKSNNENYKKIMELKTILGKPVTSCLQNYINRRKELSNEIDDEKIKSFLERVSYEVDCLNKVYIPQFLNNPDYQKDIYEFRDLVLSRLSKLKLFYKNYRNINVFQILLYYGISIFHLEFLSFEYDHPEESQCFEKLQKCLYSIDKNEFEKLSPYITYVEQDNNSESLKKQTYNKRKHKLFIINQINRNLRKQLNPIDEEIVDNYTDLNSNISEIDKKIENIHDLVNQCHDICEKYSISNYIIKYVFGIHFLTY